MTAKSSAAATSMWKGEGDAICRDVRELVLRCQANALKEGRVTNRLRPGAQAVLDFVTQAHQS